MLKQKKKLLLLPPPLLLLLLLVIVIVITLPLIFGPCPLLSQGFEIIEFLRGEVVSPMPNPQLGGPGYLPFSSNTIETSPAWMALTATRLQPT